MAASFRPLGRQAAVQAARALHSSTRKKEQAMVMVKKIMMGVGLSALVATSAVTLTMAQSYQPEVGSGNIVQKQGGPVTSQQFGRTVF